MVAYFYKKILNLLGKVKFRIKNKHLNSLSSQPHLVPSRDSDAKLFKAQVQIRDFQSKNHLVLSSIGKFCFEAFFLRFLSVHNNLTVNTLQ